MEKIVNLPSKSSCDTSRARSRAIGKAYAVRIREFVATSRKQPLCVDEIAQGTGIPREKVSQAIPSMMAWAGGIQLVHSQKGRSLYAKPGWKAPVEKTAEPKGEYAMAAPRRGWNWRTGWV